MDHIKSLHSPSLENEFRPSSPPEVELTDTMEPEDGHPQVVTESSAPEVSAGTDPESLEASSSEVPDVEPSVPPLGLPNLEVGKHP